MFKKYLLFAATSLLLVSGATTAKQSTTQFYADIHGEFGITGGVGQSPLFVVEEFGEGIEATLGAFTFTTYLLQNLARIPPNCGDDSSTGVDGFGVLDFAEGQLRLQRATGTACFAPPYIVLEEKWRIASGTGVFVGATGKLTRDYTGVVGPFEGTGTFKGRIKIVERPH